MAIISSGIWDIDPTVTDGTQLAGYLNELVKAINTNQSSATRPPMIKKGGLWTKTLSGSDIAVMVYDGTKDYEIGKIVGGDIQLDSIWTEIGDVAVYDGDITVNGVTVGRGNTTSGTIDSNTAVGQNALTNNTTGVLNTAIGRNALRDNKDGSNNTAVGYYSLVNSSGGNNTALGRAAGLTLTTGNNNILIGSEAEPSSATVSNEVTIGNDSVTNTRLKGVLAVRSNGHNFDINPDSLGEATSIFSGRELRFYVGDRSYASQKFSINGRFNLGCAVDNTTNGVTLSGDIGNGVQSYRPITGGGVHHFASDVGGSNSLKSYINENGSLNVLSGFDSRTIENSKPIESALDKVNKLKPITYDFKGSDSKGIGFFAHELQEVISEAVVGKKDQKKKDGTPFYQGVDITKVIPYLTKAIQELSEKDKLIDMLEARLEKIEDQLKKKKK